MGRAGIASNGKHNGSAMLALMPLPAISTSGDLPISHLLALMLAILVLAFAGTTIAGHRRRERLQREHLQAIRDREQRLRLSLWASNELYWQYDLPTRTLEKTRVLPDPANDLIVQSSLDTDPQIHPDDVAMVQQHLRDYLQGRTQIFTTEHLSLIHI